MAQIILNSNFKQIVFLTPGFAQNEQDNTTIPAIQIFIKALKNKHPDLKITILSFHYPFTKQKYKWHNCEVIPLNGGNKRYKKIQVWKNAYQTLKNLNKENPISIIHSFWLSECAFIGHWFSKKYKIQHLCTIMGQDVLSKNYYLKLLPLKKMNLIFVSDFQQQQFIKTYNLHSKVIHWGIDNASFSYNTSKSIDIIGVGSLIPLKNYELFIDIIFEVNKIIPVKTLIIGEGIEKKNLQKKIKNLKLENSITLTGLLNYNKTMSYISKSKILLHTSNYEGFGMIFAEALQGKTMIVSKNVGCAFASENWRICTTKEEMINACVKVLSTSFSESEKNPYLIEKTVENYLKIYNE